MFVCGVGDFFSFGGGYAFARGAFRKFDIVGALELKYFVYECYVVGVGVLVDFFIIGVENESWNFGDFYGFY